MEQLILRHRKRIIELQTKFRNNLIDTLPFEERMLGLMGARGVGKTTLLLQHISEKHGLDSDCLYISLDDIYLPYDTLYQFAEEFYKRGGKYLFIDEIHKYSNWSQELKNIYDNFPTLKIVFTGSSILDIGKGKADLSRRALIFRMQGLSFRQFLQIESSTEFEIYTLNQIIENHEQIAFEINKKIKPFEYFEKYLKFGYFPYYLESQNFYDMRLSNVINQIIEIDLPQVLNIDNQYISKLKRFINILSNGIPYKPNVSQLAGAIEISWQSVIHYINYLAKAELLNIVYPAGKSISSLAKPEKIFLHHPNFYYVFKDTITNKGSLRETFFVNQLSYKHKVEIAQKGDFLINEKYIFEIGGKSKDYNQIANLNNSFVVADEIEIGYKNKIPLWLFGFLY